jgi:hypothetical protein
MAKQLLWILFVLHNVRLMLWKIVGFHLGLKFGFAIPLSIQMSLQGDPAWEMTDASGCWSKGAYCFYRSEGKLILGVFMCYW